MVITTTSTSTGILLYLIFPLSIDTITKCDNIVVISLPRARRELIKNNRKCVAVK